MKMLKMVDSPHNTNIEGGKEILVKQDSLCCADWPYRIASNHMAVFIHRADIASVRAATPDDLRKFNYEV